MKHDFLKPLTATVVGLLLAVSASAITCSAGDSGRCFTYGDSGTILPYSVCVWTGKEADTCRWLGRFARTLLTYLN